MARVLVTGSAGGLGRNTVVALLEQGHQAVLHARNHDRLNDAQDLLERGALSVTGDLSTHQGTLSVAEEANTLGNIDAVIHNAGTYSGPDVQAVNVLAPYLLTCLITRPDRHVYLSSSMHSASRTGTAALRTLLNPDSPMDYADSKLLVTALAASVARRRPELLSNAVDPGWVPTRMGGPQAPDELELGHVTQTWLATSSDPQAHADGGYWHHQQQQAAHPAVHDEDFRNELLDTLARRTGIALTAR
ncbi:SDR family NAD(P)-dependent oxidoreductase [Streptomyces sulphureus]|uniref:SDR family NAD(P)-dependent oxidoreductase n=1 Tax=Streptomyces sulphureus TaxID=47758 RepID=UPI000378DCD8|nr:SDR family NAD(P)-dependent oxidoreductase [Streptomyces sulphureus]